MSNMDAIDDLVGVFELVDPDETVDLGQLYEFAEATFKAGWTPPGPDPDDDPPAAAPAPSSNETPTPAATLDGMAWRLCRRYPMLTIDQARAAVRLATELTTPTEQDTHR